MVLQSKFVQIYMALIFDSRQGLPRTLLYAGLQDYSRAVVLRLPTLYMDCKALAKTGNPGRS